MHVAAVQFKPRKGDPAAALARLIPLCEQAAAGQDLDLLVLPEMAATGYIFSSPEAIAPYAEAPTGPTFQALAPVAAAHRTWLVAGFPERDGDRLFNSALVINPRGELAFTYRKTLLFEADTLWASPGDSGYRAFESRRGDFTVGICMDLNDDDFVSWCAQRRPRAVAFPTNWLDQGVPVWPYWAWRMGGTESALVAANTYGPEAPIRFAGCSAILDQGVILAHSGPQRDAVITATLSDRRV